MAQSITLRFSDQTCAASDKEKDCHINSKRYHFVTMYKVKFASKNKINVLNKFFSGKFFQITSILSHA